MSKEIIYRCKYCKKELPQNHVGECPNCHQTEKEIIGTINETVNILETQRRIMGFKKYVWKWILITLVFDFVGLFLDNILMWSISFVFKTVTMKVLGFIIIVITTITGYWAVTEHKESSN